VFLSGFKKNVNRATTQVMMKTGMSQLLPRNCMDPEMDRYTYFEILELATGTGADSTIYDA
jgi:hypothetical protein